MKRWEFTGETKKVFGVVLRRIRATVTFTLTCGITINAGEVGGWIEKENNLCGDAWVYGNAQVYGNARVYGDALVCGNAQVYVNARVYGNALVYGNAQVYGDARVYGNAQVCGDAWVYGNALMFGNAHYLLIGRIGSRSDFTTFTRDKSGVIHVKCGCFFGTIAEFRKKVQQTHGDNKYGRVYQAAADLAELQIDTTPIEDTEAEHGQG